MASFRSLVLGSVVALSALTGIAHADAPTTEFQQGLADREAWESWFSGLADVEYKSGAYLWSGQRSLANPTPCDSLGGKASMGCYAAKARLDISDSRRRLAPAYKQGWNSYIAPAPKPEEKPAPAPQPTTVVVQQSMSVPAAPAPVVFAPTPAPVVVAPAPVTSFPAYDVVASCHNSAVGGHLCVTLAYDQRAMSLRMWPNASEAVRAECRYASDPYGDYGTLMSCMSGHGIES